MCKTRICDSSGAQACSLRCSSVHSIRSLTSTHSSAGLQEQDWSQHWVTYLEKPLPQLPNTQADVEAVLFPAQPDIRIPVNPVYYHMAKTCYPKTAAQLLKQADASLLVARLTSLLDQQWREGYTELHTSVHVVRFIEEVFGSLEEYSSHNVTCNIMLNSTEQSSTASSRTAREKLRPDTTVALNKCTLLLGEDKFSVLADAIEDLKRKRLELTSAHYGPVHFLLAYAAAGKEFQWFWMSSDGKQVSLVLSSIHSAVCVQAWQQR